MKYTVYVKEISYGTIEVEADNKDEAEKIAEAQYTLGNTFWSSGEYELNAEEVRTHERNEVDR